MESTVINTKELMYMAANNKAPFYCPRCRNYLTKYLDGYVCDTADDVCGFKLHKICPTKRYVEK